MAETRVLIAKGKINFELISKTFRAYNELRSSSDLQNSEGCAPKFLDIPDLSSGKQNLDLFQN
jgi:hypothetical protein